MMMLMMIIIILLLYSMYQVPYFCTLCYCSYVAIRFNNATLMKLRFLKYLLDLYAFILVIEWIYQV